MNRWFRRQIAAAILFACIAAASAAGGAIYFKDGFAAFGRVRREMELIIDPATGRAVPIVKGSSSYFILDDRVRNVIFTQRQVDSVDENKEVFDTLIVLGFPLGARTRAPLPALAQLGEPTKFDAKGERKYPFTTAQGKYVALQKLTLLSPYFCKVESHQYEWTANYMTREFDPAELLPLVRAHPDIAGKPGEPAVFENRFKLFRFCTQAGWIEEARRELAALRQQFPNETKKLEAAEAGLRQQLQQKFWEDAELAARVGQPQRAAELLRELTPDELPAALRTEAATLKTKIEATHLKLEQTRKLLLASFDKRSGPLPDWLGAALKTMKDELNADTVDRLEAFTVVARQIEQDDRGGKQPKYSVDQALALAVSAWAMGPQGGEPNVAKAEQLWQIREALLAYQRLSNAIDRKKIVATIEKAKNLSLAEIARIITLLPPSEAGVARAGTATERNTRNPFSPRPSYPYRIQLPPEYHPNRAYPLLVVLPDVNDSTERTMNRWSAEAARNGFVLASVDWGLARSTYEYTMDEHFAPIECVRDVKRLAQIDSDRVFLAGSGEGASLAMDAGLSHPDLFAGIVPFNPWPRDYATEWYWRNAQSLPFYLVLGELSGKVRNWSAKLYEAWADHGYPSIMVMYRGRPTDFFTGEIPNTFDWMSRKHRAAGFPELGRHPNSGYNGEEYQMFRPTDNRFFWVSADQIAEKFTALDFVKYKTGTGTPAAVHAIIRDGNQVAVSSRGVKRMTLWFGRMYDTAGGVKDMVDLTKPIKITANGRPVAAGKNAPLTSSLETLLDDFSQRGDGQRLFFASVEFTIP